MERGVDTTRTEYRIAMPYEDYQKQFQDNKFIEWVDGEAIVFALPTTRHQRMVLFLNTLLGTFLSVYPSGISVISPFEMRLTPTGNARVPDLLYVEHQNRGRIDEWRLNGPADLVIEIIDEETVNRDRVEKFNEYQAAGIREYWIIDPRPTSARADFWVLDEDGRYRPVPIEPDGIYRSTVLPNFKLDVNSLLSDELPDPLKALADMVGVEPLLRVMGHGQ